MAYPEVILSSGSVPVPPIPPTITFSVDDTPPTSSDFMTVDGLNWASTKLRMSNARHDYASRYAGAWGVPYGQCKLSAGTGLSVVIAAGHLIGDGVIWVTAAITKSSLTDATRNHLWAVFDTVTKAVSISASTSTTPPAGQVIYLGSALCAAGVVSTVDYSGVAFINQVGVWRVLANAGAPGDSLDASLVGFKTKTAGGIYMWDGSSHLKLTP